MFGFVNMLIAITFLVFSLLPQYLDCRTGCIVESKGDCRKCVSKEIWSGFQEKFCCLKNADWEMPGSLPVSKL